MRKAASGVEPFLPRTQLASIHQVWRSWSSFPKGLLMLSILAAYAQEESLSASENQKWRIRKNFEEGKPWNGTMLGYRYHNGTLVIEPGEAEIVRRIFREYLSGKGVISIANGLNADWIVTRYGNQWHKRSVTCVLQNYAYTGNLLLQTTFRENHLAKRSLPNDGQLPKYHAKGTHEAIISMEDFTAAQAEMEKRSAKHAPQRKELHCPIPLLRHDRLRKLRQALPTQGHSQRPGLDLQHLQPAGQSRLPIQADPGGRVADHDRRYGSQ